MNNRKKIKVVIIDDNPMTRLGIKAALSVNPDMEVIGEGSNGEGAFPWHLGAKPDVILMDMNMPGMNGIEATRAIVSSFPYAKIIALTNHTDSKTRQAAEEAGVAEFLGKDISASTLSEAIRTVYANPLPLR